MQEWERFSGRWEKSENAENAGGLLCPHLLHHPVNFERPMQLVPLKNTQSDRGLSEDMDPGRTLTVDGAEDASARKGVGKEPKKWRAEL